MVFENDFAGFALQYSIEHQEDLNQQRISDVHVRWDKLNESQNELLNMMQSFCETVIQQKQAANIDQSPPQEMSIQDMEYLKQQYLDEMKSMINQIQIKDYRNERIDIHYRRECEIKIDEFKVNFNGMNPSSIAITPVLLNLEPEDSLIMGDEDLNTIPEKESDKVIQSSVEDLVPIPSESEDTSRSDSEYDFPSCDDFSPIDVPEGKFMIFSNPLFDSNGDFTSSDDESLSDEDVLEDNFKFYPNPLFEFDNEYISSDVNPLFDEDDCFDPGDDIKLLLHRDLSIPKMSVASILEGFTNEPPLKENDNLFDLESKETERKKILYNAPIDDLMTKDCSDFKDSRARGFVHRLLKLQSLSYGNSISWILLIIVYLLAYLINGFRFA
uniref:Uncharacterized protein n=1 Tax=Tanacetum cinerariifolium TaxID=118510 RepID=A0A6L2LCI1_TANCI|nr:hypothetical protein [Tanacetum cinerariifolium]